MFGLETSLVRFVRNGSKVAGFGCWWLLQADACSRDRATTQGLCSMLAIDWQLALCEQEERDKCFPWNGLVIQSAAISQVLRCGRWTLGAMLARESR
jgi:hypothetical protein